MYMDLLKLDNHVQHTACKIWEERNRRRGSNERTRLDRN
jgi:hypothetical protein